MKDFDLNKIGKEMPYKAPREEFFEEFTSELMAKIEEPQPRTHKLFWRREELAPLIGLAAAIIVVITLSLNLSSSEPKGTEYIISENIEESFDSFFGNLSDEELAYLAAESSYNEDFYNNLLND